MPTGLPMAETHQQLPRTDYYPNHALWHCVGIGPPIVPLVGLDPHGNVIIQFSTARFNAVLLPCVASVVHASRSARFHLRFNFCPCLARWPAENLCVDINSTPRALTR